MNANERSPASPRNQVVPPEIGALGLGFGIDRSCAADQPDTADVVGMLVTREPTPLTSSARPTTANRES